MASTSTSIRAVNLLLLVAACNSLRQEQLNIDLSPDSVVSPPMWKKEGVVPEGDSSGIYIKSRDMLPSIAEDAVVDIYYAEAGIPIFKDFGIMDGPLAKITTAPIDIYHSGITLRINETGENMTLQFYATVGMFAAEVPVLEKATESVNFTQDRAVLGYADFINETYWKQERIFGTATGKMLNQYFDFVARWAQANQHYQLFSIFKDDELKYEDTTCFTFVEHSFKELLRIGATWRGEKMRRNTMKLPSSTEPELFSVMNLENNNSVDEVPPKTSIFTFFSALEAVRQKMDFKMSFHNIVGRFAALRNVFKVYEDKTSYIWDGNKDAFIKWTRNFNFRNVLEQVGEIYHVMSIFEDGGDDEKVYVRNDQNYWVESDVKEK